MELKGRITKGVGGLYYIDTEKGVYSGRARGKFRLQNIKPTIGDFVTITVLDEIEKECSVDDILPRKNWLVRPSVANIDHVFIVFALKNPNPNLDLLDKFILVCEHNDLELTICLNKSDLLLKDEQVAIKELYESIGYEVILLSTYEDSGIKELKEKIMNKVSVFAGPSGVGKSSIFNKLFPDANMEIGGLSEKIQRGKHTTRHVELVEILEDTFLVDSPGFTSLSIEDIDKDILEFLFKEFRPYLTNCRYNNCIHIKESGCAIKEHVGKEIDVDRYNRYVNFYNEMKDRDDFLLKK